MHSTSGIILRREDFRERDERLTLYTRDFGKISVVAKGVKRIEAKLRGSLDILNLVEVLFVEGSSLFILTGVEIRERFGALGENSHRYAAALCAARMVDRVFEEGVRDDEFFDFFSSAIERLDQYSEEDKEKGDESLFSWLVLKKIEMTILKNQGAQWGGAASKNARTFLEMLGGARHASARLTKYDLMSIENIFARSFEDAFGYRPHSWIPAVS